MTELSFLIELLLNHELQKDTKTLIASRIKEVEANLVPRSLPQQQFTPQPMPFISQTLKQAPSTLALMEKHGDIPPGTRPLMPPPEVEPVKEIAKTVKAAEAMASRNEAIAAAIAGKVDKVTGRPRKW